jgi:hypothetical protein
MFRTFGPSAGNRRPPTRPGSTAGAPAAQRGGSSMPTRHYAPSGALTGSTPPSAPRSSAVPHPSLTATAAHLLAYHLLPTIPGVTPHEIVHAAAKLGILGALHDTVGHLADQLVHDAAKAASNATRGLDTNKPVSSFLGRKTLGTPTVGSILRSNQAGQTRINRGGQLTTPPVRQAVRGLHQAQAKFRRTATPSYPGLSPSQAHVTQAVLSQGRKLGANRKELLSAVETGLVESRLSNPAGGDGTSMGWRQETASSYPGVNRLNVKQSAQRYFNEAAAKGGGVGQTAGTLAQSVQRSAYPARYDQAKSQAAPILRDFLHGKAPPKVVAQLASAKTQAQQLGIATGGPSRAPKAVVTRFKAAFVAANQLANAHIPYVWGGGHGSPTSSPTGGGLDCSGAVGFVLNKIGAMKGSLTSGDMGKVLKPGPGAITVFYNGGHTFMRIGKKYWGTSVGDSGAGGLGYHPAPNAAYLAQYNVGHVPGLGKKQALQLGIPLTGGGFPGMALSPSGTTATITSGVTQKKAGFSSQPVLGTISTPFAAQAALPDAFSQFQLGAGPSQAASTPSNNIIEQILSRRRA